MVITSAPRIQPDGSCGRRRHLRRRPNRWFHYQDRFPRRAQCAKVYSKNQASSITTSFPYKMLGLTQVANPTTGQRGSHRRHPGSRVSRSSLSMCDFSWERGRLVRIEREARKQFSKSSVLSVLRTLCGRDVRAPGKKMTATENSDLLN